MKNSQEIAMLYDSSLCTGCKGCQVACKQWNGLYSPLGLNEQPFSGSLQAPFDLNGDTRLIQTFSEKPSGNKLQPIAWAIGRKSCMHCTDAACVEVCSTNALFKEENGVISFDTDKCSGCGYCKDACPFDVPRYHGDKDVIDKCTMCLDRLEKGELPACVKSCQPEALKFGDRKEMIAIGNARVEFLKAKGFDKAELYGVNEMGGLHVLNVCKYGHEAYGLPTNPQKNPMINLLNLAKPATVAAGGAVLAGLALSFVAGMGYRRKEVGLEEAKKTWTPEQREKADKELKERLANEKEGKND